MTRQSLYLIILSLLLLIGTVAFSFLMLIPKGKEYRLLRLENKKQMQEYEIKKEEYERVRMHLEELETKHAKTIQAFRAPFDPGKFTKRHEKEFEDLYLTEVTTFDKNGSFTVYEVNATSKITSPQSFYHFLESVNHSGWIIEVNFPIHFEREDDRIRSSFTMKVHSDAVREKKEEK